MNRRSSPGIGQWLIVALLVALVVFLLIKLYQYGSFRQFFPAGLEIGSIDVGGLTREEAADRISERYLSAPVIVYHGDETIEVSPTDIEFVLDLESMLGEADYQRQQQDFWSGFWGYLWNRPIEVEQIELHANHNPQALEDVLGTLSTAFDKPALPPQPVPTTLSFQYGEPGISTDIESSITDVQAAFYRAIDREARLALEPTDPTRPDINLLARLIVNHLQGFDGVASIFIMDLASGEEVTVNPDIAMSGMSVVKVPIALETFRTLEDSLSLEQQKLISETLVVQSGNFSANLLLDVIAGEDNAFLGADILTESMQKLGLENTFIAVPYEERARPGRATYETSANSVDGLLTLPDPAMQTTAEDMGTLLAMLYRCAEDGGGAFAVAYEGEVTQEECRLLVEYMDLNHIGSLIEEGVPDTVSVAHKHGWISDTHGDAGIVYSPGGDYVIVTFMYKPEWLEWEISSPLLADISRATYNFFNFDDPYLSDSGSS